MTEPAWDDCGLCPAVVQHADSGAVLMLAWMNAEALELTRATREVHFWSRSRQALWRKGETSGHTLALVELRLDCDRDALLVLARPNGPTCHTGRPSCFFSRDDGGEWRAGGAEWITDDGPAGAPAAILDRLAAVLRQRRDHATGDKSYTRSLLDGGFPRILAKIAEEHGELAAELPAGPRAAVVHETADLLFHVLVGLTARDIEPAELWSELERRFGTGGHAEKAAR